MKMRRNLIAGFLNSIWSAIVGLAAVPFYLKYLGIEAYGLIGFFVMAQAVLALLDLGLSPTINREVARHSVSGDISESGGLLHSLAIVFWGMAGVIALGFFTLSSFVAEYWLQANSLPQDTVMKAVILMGIVIACRWPVGLYQGALIGAQRLAVYCGISAVMVTLGSLGAVAVLAFISPTIEAFFIWQACVGFLFAVTMRYAAWRVIGRIPGVRFDINSLKRIWRFSAGVGAVAVAAIILIQLDKVLLSRILSLEDFGRYALAGVVTSALYLLVNPVFNAIYPRLSALVATGDTVKLIELYRMGTRAFCAAILPFAVAGVFFSESLISVWTQNPELAASVAPIVSLLLIGTALNGVMHFPYALQLAYGVTRLPLLIAIILIVFMVPLIIVLSLTYGAVGGAAAWAVLNCVYLFLGTYLTHRLLLKGVGRKWLLIDVMAPLGVSLLIVGGGWLVQQLYDWQPIIRLLVGSGVGMFACAVIVMSSGRLRHLFLIQYGELRNRVL